jgi:hypothetical protein
MAASSSTSRRILRQLQRTAKMVGEQDARRPRARPNTRTDKRPTALATRSQYRSSGRKIRRPDILRHIHLHAIDDGQKILALQVEPSDRRDVIRQASRRTVLVQRVDIVTPLLKRRQPFRAADPSESAMSSTCRQKL